MRELPFFYTEFVLKCDAQLRPGDLLRHSLDTYIIILRTLDSFLIEKLFCFICFVSFLKILNE